VAANVQRRQSSFTDGGGTATLPSILPGITTCNDRCCCMSPMPHRISSFTSTRCASVRPPVAAHAAMASASNDSRAAVALALLGLPCQSCCQKRDTADGGGGRRAARGSVAWPRGPGPSPSMRMNTTPAAISAPAVASIQPANRTLRGGRAVTSRPPPSSQPGGAGPRLRSVTPAGGAILKILSGSP